MVAKIRFIGRCFFVSCWTRKPTITKDHWPILFGRGPKLSKVPISTSPSRTPGRHPLRSPRISTDITGSRLARGRILDWFHVAMKFKAAANSVFGSATIQSEERVAVETEIDHAKWLAWHGK